MALSCQGSRASPSPQHPANESALTSLKGGAYRADPIPPPEQARTLSVPKQPPPSPRGPLSWAPMISSGILAVDEDAFQRVQVPSPRAVALLGGLPGEGGQCAPRRCLVRLRGGGGNRTRSHRPLTSNPRPDRQVSVALCCRRERCGPAARAACGAAAPRAPAAARGRPPASPAGSPRSPGWPAPQSS